MWKSRGREPKTLERLYDVGLMCKNVLEIRTRSRDSVQNQSQPSRDSQTSCSKMLWPGLINRLRALDTGGNSGGHRFYLADEATELI